MINYSTLGYEVKRDLSKFSTKISNGLKRPQQKFIYQMIYGILVGNKLHLSEIARSLKENITLKKTIERLSRNLHAFNAQQILWHNYLSLVKQHVKNDYAVIVIDNSDIVKPASTKLEALADVRDGSTGKIAKGYQTIEAAVLSETGNMPLPIYEKVFSAMETGFISETHENLCCLKALSAHFSTKYAHWTEVLMRMIITDIFSKTKNALSYELKRTAVSFIMEIPITLWRWHANTKGTFI